MHKIVALGLSMLLPAVVLAQAKPKASAPKTVPPATTQRSKAAPAKPVPKKSADLYSKAPFDKTVSKVPEGFRGHNLASLFGALSDKLKAKGEFETTEAYNKRIEAALSEPLVGELTAKSILASVIPLTSGSEFSNLKYNADAQLLSVDKSMDEVPYDLGDYETRSKQRVLSTGLGFEKVIRTYTGQNSFGIKRRVVEKESYSCDLILLNPGELGFKKDQYDVLGDRQNIVFDVQMDPATAQKAKQNLKLLVLFQVGPPYVGNAKDYDSPTIDDPVEVTSYKFYIYANVIEVWLYDSKTGEIYARFPPAQGGKEEPTS
jgi:hypothetical protein